MFLHGKVYLLAAIAIIAIGFRNTGASHCFRAEDARTPFRPPRPNRLHIVRGFVTANGVAVLAANDLMFLVKIGRLEYRVGKLPPFRFPLWFVVLWKFLFITWWAIASLSWIVSIFPNDFIVVADDERIQVFCRP